MANPNKAQDPAAAALSAIEDALNLADLTASALPKDNAEKGEPSFELSSDDRIGPPVVVSTSKKSRDGSKPKLPTADASQMVPQRLVGIRADENLPSLTESAANVLAADKRDGTPPSAERPKTSRAATPANDDQESVGAILRTLQTKTSRTPMIVAGLASVLWIAACAFYLYTDRANLVAASLLQPKTALVALAIVGPLLFFFMTAGLARRAQEVRITARSMLQVAVRLAEPEAIATEQMVTLSQAIRREVASMGDGIERALARASELEMLVRSEVSNIERSFGENERRVRSLIDELSSEREAIVTNAEKVRGAISGAHETLSRDLDGLSDRLASSLGEAGERVASSLDGKGEEIRVALVSAGELAAKNLGSSGNEVVMRLREATDTVSAAIHGQSSELEGKFASAGQRLVADLDLRAVEIVDRLGETGARITDQIATGGDALATRLAETQDRLHDAVAVQGNALHENLGEMGERIAALITERTEAATSAFDASQAGLATFLEDNHGKIHARFEEHSAELHERLAKANEALTNQHIEMHERLGTTATESVNALMSSIDSLHERLETTTSETTEALNAHHDAMHERLAGTASEAVSALAKHTDTLQQKIGGVAHEALTAFTGHVDAMHDKLNEIAAETTEVLSAHTDAMHERLADTAQQTLDALTEHTAGMHERLEATAGDTLAALDSHSETLGGRLEEVARQTVEGLREASSSAVEAVDTSAQGVQDRLTGVATQTLAALDDHASAMHARLGETAEHAVNQLAGHLDGMHEQLAANAEATADALGQHAEALQEGFVANTRQAIASLAEQVAALNARFAEIASESVSAIGMHGNRVNDALAERLAAFEQAVLADGGEAGFHAERFNATLTDRLGAIENTFALQGNDLNEAMGRHLHDASGLIERQIAELEAGATERMQAISTALETLVARIDSGLESRAKAINDSLAARTIDMARTLAEGGREVNKVLTANTSQIVTLTNSLADKASSIDSMLGEHAQRLNDRLGLIESTIGQKGKVFNIELAARTHELQALFNDRGTQLVDTLVERGGAVANEMTSVGEIVTQTIAQRAQAIVEHLGQKQVDLTNALDRSSAQLRQAIDSGVGSSLQSLISANENLRADLGVIIERLDTTSSSLRDALGGANQHFDKFQVTVGDRLRALSVTVSDAQNHIERINESTGKTIAAAGSIAETLVGHHDAIGHSTSKLVSTQSDIERGLASRQAALEKLLQIVSTKHEDFQAVMNSFTGMIEDSFRNAETRARQIGTFLSDASQSSTGMIEEQFAAIRNNAGKERERTAAAMRAAYDQAAQEVDSIFGQSTHRFHKAAEEMRGLSRTIQEELAATREEIRRNAIELPRETSEQAASMRRVVVDQVKALNELTGIVTRSGRSLDLSQPDPGATTSRELATIPAETPRRDPPPRAQVPPAPPLRDIALTAPPPAPPRAPTPRQAARNEAPRAAIPPLAPSTQGPVPPAGASANLPRPAGSQGWLSDLLARASADDGGKHAPIDVRNGNGRAPEPLAAITTDIARMVDADAVSDAWERYRRGEENVFDRSIYMGRGGQTFEEIRRRYGNDGDFRVTVDRYVQEFERLLSQVQNDDPDDRMLRGYLGSDSGKVYTMLAHAAGRLN